MENTSYKNACAVVCCDHENGCEETARDIVHEKVITRGGNSAPRELGGPVKCKQLI